MTRMSKVFHNGELMFEEQAERLGEYLFWDWNNTDEAEYMERRNVMEAALRQAAAGALEAFDGPASAEDLAARAHQILNGSRNAP
jgi:hypothetical protein